MKKIFLSQPLLKLDSEQELLFEHIFQNNLSQENTPSLITEIPFPKFKFLYFILKTKNVLLHGSNQKNLEILIPQKQTDYKGDAVNAVFASGDAIWPIFFAILDQKIYKGGIRNACIKIQHNQQKESHYYFFSLEKAGLLQKPWTDGMIYVVSKESFNPTSTGIVRFDEWMSNDPIKILMALHVQPNDFPFLNNISGHQKGESMIKSWLFYKWRLSKLKNNKEK